MGKIVKYCSSCDEGFAEKFSFCPNCANELSAFEMKPVSESTDSKKVSDEGPDSSAADTIEANSGELIPGTVTSFTADKSIDLGNVDGAKDEAVFEPVSFDSGNVDAEDDIGIATESKSSGEDEYPDEEIETSFESSADKNEKQADKIETDFEQADNDDSADDTIETKFSSEDAVDGVDDDEVDTIIAVPPAISKVEGLNSNKKAAAASFADDEPVRNFDFYRHDLEDDFGVTVIQDQSSGVLRGLIMGAAVLMLMTVLSGMVYSLYNYPLLIGEIGESDLLMPVLDVEPVDMPEEKPKVKNEDDGGGGGGGGNERKEKASKGELPTQVLNPPPIIMMRAKTDPTLAYRNATQGTITRNRTGDIGIPDGADTGRLSSGRGRGGGIGGGDGTGVGNGRGTGEGNGIGSGSGNGRGNGIGDGDGDGRGRNVAPPPPRPTPREPEGPTTAIQILSKPRATYTDAARTNNVQGKVLVRVTFLANGQIGSVAAVKGLPYGLTERALAAARQIQFKPAMRNGQPYPVTKSIQYSFTIY